MPGRPQGIPEVPSGIDPTVRRYLMEIRKAIKRLEGSVIPPRPVTNLRATAKAGGVILQFTRSDGDTYILYWNSTAGINGATRIDLGLANEYVDEIGDEGVKRYYWIKVKKGQMESEMAGPVYATTLALDAEITPPTRPPASENLIKSDETGEYHPSRPTATTHEVV